MREEGVEVQSALESRKKSGLTFLTSCMRLENSNSRPLLLPLSSNHFLILHRKCCSDQLSFLPCFWCSPGTGPDCSTWTAAAAPELTFVPPVLPPTLQFQLLPATGCLSKNQAMVISLISLTPVFEIHVSSLPLGWILNLLIWPIRLFINAPYLIGPTLSSMTSQKWPVIHEDTLYSHTSASLLYLFPWKPLFIFKFHYRHSSVKLLLISSTQEALDCLVCAPFHSVLDVSLLSSFNIIFLLLFLFWNVNSLRTGIMTYSSWHFLSLLESLMYIKW